MIELTTIHCYLYCQTLVAVKNGTRLEKKSELQFLTVYPGIHDHCTL